MKALLMTSDPYEPSGVIGLFETEEQRLAIIEGFKESHRQYCLESNKVAWRGMVQSPEDIEKYAERRAAELKEIDIPIGVYGEYY